MADTEEEKRRKKKKIRKEKTTTTKRKKQKNTKKHDINDALPVLRQVHSELKRLWYRHRYQKGDPTAFTRSFAASSYRKTCTTSSARSPQASTLLPRSTAHTAAKPLALHRLRGLSSSSSELDRPQELLTDAERRRLRMQKARSHDLDHEAFRDAQSREPGGELLRQAIQGDVLAKRAALKKQSTSESVTSDGDACCLSREERSPLTSPNREERSPLTSSNREERSPLTSPNREDRSPLTSPNACVTAGDEGGKFVWDNNRNSSAAIL